MKLSKTQHAKLVKHLEGWAVGEPTHFITQGEAENLTDFLSNTIELWLTEAFGTGWFDGYREGMVDEWTRVKGAMVDSVDIEDILYPETEDK